MKRNSYKTFITILLILAVAIVMACIIVSVAPVKRSSKADKVDLSCVAEPSKNPLKDCKQSKKYALECGPQYVKLPKEKCEIKEAK